MGSVQNNGQASFLFLKIATKAVFWYNKRKKEFIKQMLIKVKVFPGSKKEEIIKKSEDTFEVWVKEKPIRGEANRAVVSLLSSCFGISKEGIRLIKGFKERNKIFEIK